MTWREIKEAVTQAGVTEDAEIALIQCEDGRATTLFMQSLWVRVKAHGKRVRRSVAE